MSALIDKIRGSRTENMIWKLIAFFSLFALLVVSWKSSEAINRDPVIISVDNDTYRLPKIVDFEAAANLHEGQAELALETIFDRNPEALDHRKRLGLLFEKKAYDKVLEMAAEENEGFLRKQMHQKVEVHTMNIISLSDKSVKAVIGGQLLRMGTFQGHPIDEGFRFTGQITFYWNRNMRGNGGYPTLVRDFDFDIQPK